MRLVLATPTVIGTDAMNIINIWQLAYTPTRCFPHIVYMQKMAVSKAHKCCGWCEV